MAVSGRRGTGGNVILSANCPASVLTGDFVYITGDRIAGKLQVAKVDITDAAKMPAFAMVVSKETSTDCSVQKIGTITGVYSGLSPQTVFFVGTDGRIAETAPNPGVGETIYVQPAGIVTGSDQIDLSLEKIPIKRSA